MAGPSAPRSIDRFEVLGVLGEGAMGQVLRARDPRLDREVAIKLLRPEVDDPRAPLHAEEARKRLIREARAMARLDHPNVIGIHEVGESDGRVYLVMERVEGRTLRAWRDAAPRTWPAIRAVFAQIVDGLAAAHDAGLVHRDIKPDNILIGDDGRVRVTDFGLVAPPGARDAVPAVAEPDDAVAAVTHHGAILGTPGYQAPELLRDGVSSVQSDQFALCVTLYEIAFGLPPFPTHSHRERTRAVLAGTVREPPPATDVPAAAIAAIHRGLRVEPDARWPDVRALLAALDTPAPPIDAPPRARPRLALIGGGVVVAGAIAGAFVLTRGDAAPSAPPADAAAPAAAPLPAAAELLIDTGMCDRAPTFVDETTVVYEHMSRDGNDLRIRDLVTGDDRALTSTPTVIEMRPHAAIGERAVVYLRREATEGGAGPTRLDLDTGVEAPVPGGDGGFLNAGASLVRGALYYVAGAGATLVRVDGDVVTEVAQFPGEYIWDFTPARDAPVAVLQVSGSGLCTLPLDRPAEPTCHKTAEPPYGTPAISADGDIIYYAAVTGIRRYIISTRHDELVVADHGINGGMALSPSGRTLLWSECQPQIDITDLADRRVVHAESLTSPSSNRLGAWAFVRELPAASLVAYRHFPGGLVHVLTDISHGFPGPPALSPDDDRMVFSLGGAKPGLYLTRGAGHQPLRRITEGDAEGGPVWTADGRIAFTRMIDAAPVLHVVDPDTGALERPHPQPRWTYDRQLDGPWLLLADTERLRLFLWNPATGEEREIPIPKHLGPRVIVEADLSPDATFVAVTWGVEAWKLDVTGKAPAERLYVAEPPRGYWGVEVGADNKVYVMLSDDRGPMWRAVMPAAP